MKQYEKIYKNSLLFRLQKKWGIEGEIIFTENKLSFYDGGFQMNNIFHFGMTRIIKKELDAFANIIQTMVSDIEKVINKVEELYPSHFNRKSHRELRIGSMELTFHFEIMEYKKNNLIAVMSIKENGTDPDENEVRLMTDYKFFLTALEETLLELIYVSAARIVFVEKANGVLQWYPDEEGLLLATRSTTTNIKCEKKNSGSIHIKAISNDISLVDREDTLENSLCEFEKAITIQAKKERLSNLFSR